MLLEGGIPTALHFPGLPTATTTPIWKPLLTVFLFVSWKLFKGLLFSLLNQNYFSQQRHLDPVLQIHLTKRTTRSFKIQTTLKNAPECRWATSERNSLGYSITNPGRIVSDLSKILLFYRLKISLSLQIWPDI